MGFDLGLDRVEWLHGRRWWVSFRCSCYGAMHEQTTETWRAYSPRMECGAHIALASPTTVRQLLKERRR